MARARSDGEATASPAGSGEGGDGLVEGGGRTHHGRGLGRVGLVVATDLDRGALDGDELVDDLLLVGREGLRQRREGLGQLRVLGLGGQLLGPVQGQVEVAAAVVDTTDATGRRLVLVEEGAGGAVEGVGEDLGAGVARGGREVLEAGGQGEELAEAVPAEVVLLDELLDVLRGGRRRLPVSKRPPPAISGTTDSILALVPSSRMGKRSVR